MVARSSVAPATGGEHRTRSYQVSPAGALGGMLAAAASLTPSLLPRSAATQGLVTGVAGAVGYGLGLGLAWLLRQFTGRTGAWPGDHGTRLALLGLGSGLVAVMAWLDRGWQQWLHAQVGWSGPSLGWYPAVLAVAAGCATVLVVLSRGIWRAVRVIRRWLGHHVPRRVLAGSAVLAALLLGVAVLSGWLSESTYTLVSRPFQVVNDRLTAGVVPPTGQPVSGSPDSLIGWEGLGRNGRDFVSSAPTTAELAEFTGHAARPPVRVYAGMESAGDPRARARLAVADLVALGGFQREVLLVANSTGSGSIDTSAVRPLEFMYAGDAATVSVQYSYLPSWLSFLMDQEIARLACRELFEAVHAQWSAMPAATRPRLLVFGESLGSFGGEAAFSGVADMVNRTGGLLFAGPPNANPLHTLFTEQREPGTLERLPVFQSGRNLRFAAAPADLAIPGPAWDQPRLVYLQNASDPVVWWSPDLLSHEPDWLVEPRGDQISPALRWVPLLTFFQISMDMTDSTSVPYGHGHVYGPNQVEVWARIAAPAGWSAADTQRLTHLMGG